MRESSRYLLILLSLTCLLWSCKNIKEDLQVESVADYMPLQPGKYITYRMDSTVFTQQGRNIEIHSYQEKHIIDAVISDNLGRPTYRIFRFINDTTGTGPWSPAGSYMITPTDKLIEVIEDNMRVVKLVAPVRKDYTWKGNQYLNSDPYASQYSFSNDDFMPYWEFKYTNTNDVFNYNQQELSNVITVLQEDMKSELDTVDAVGNVANIPTNSSATWIRGSATDTVKINAAPPSPGHEQLDIFNHTNTYASLNGIPIPPGLGLSFQYFNGRWFYPNPLTVTNNRVIFPSNVSLAYIFGTATDSIKVDVSQIDTLRTKSVTIYNKSNKNAYCNFDTALSKYPIPPGYGRSYELYRKEWRLADNRDELITQDPYIPFMPYGTTSYSIEKYAKGIGLVYQELILWEFQPNPNGTPYKVGFGVKRSMIDHN